MQSYRIKIELADPASRGSVGLIPGNASYSTTPAGERLITLDATQAQIVGIQGYLTLIKAGATTTTIETAITAVGPT